MSDDLVSLRLLVVAASGPDQELWRQATAAASVIINFEACDAASAPGNLAKHGADVCVLDGALSDASKTGVIDAARAAEPPPLILVSAARGSSRPAGVDGVLSKPANEEQARKLVDICVRATMPTRALVVDDSATIRGIVRKVMSASRFALDVQETSDGMAALEHLRGGNFGIVFLDHNMPGTSGFDILKDMQREHANVAVVMMSSTPDKAIAGRAQSLGALGCLNKPFYPTDVDAMLERFFGMDVPRG